MNLFLVSVIHKVHDTPLDLPKKRDWKIFIFKKVIKVPSPQNDESSFCGPKMGFSPRFGGRENFFLLVSMVQKVHDTPLDLPKKRNWKICIFKKVIKVPPPQNDKSSFCGKNSSFCGGVGACAASFFEQRLWNFGFRPS